MIAPPLLAPNALAGLAAALSGVARDGPGSRQLLGQNWCASLAGRLRAQPMLAALLPPDAAAVQCTYFEKSAQQNWLVPLHQDLSIAVAHKVAHPGLRGWSEKEGCLFVQPPDAVLAQLVAVRLHIDHCSADDGPLRVVPCSHQHGRLSEEDAVRTRAAAGESACVVASGGALIMRPLLLHASSKSRGTGRRRVLHFVFGPRALPFGLRWQWVR
ncbi:MAG: phytanoyl-CoA dioxygenase family protein [Pseudomonadota bacterium]